MPMLCFFPWATITEPLRFGTFHLIPASEAGRTGELAPDWHEAVAAVLEPYGHTRAVNRAAIPFLRRDDLTILADLSSDQIADYFDFRTQVVFATLAARNFPTMAGRYCNSDNLRLVVQGFTRDLAGGATIQTRRRDGFTNNIVSRGHRHERRPDHVGMACELPRDLDVPLLHALQLAHLSDGAEDARLAEAMRLFVGANTDSPDVPMHAELVDTTSALSLLVDEWKKEATVPKLLQLLPAPPYADFVKAGARAQNQRISAAASVGRPVRHAWLDDAFDLRNAYAHGRVALARCHSAWNVFEHLLLAAIFFPLAVKAMLRIRSCYEFTAYDDMWNVAFDSLATLRPFFVGEDEDEDESDADTWVRVLQNARMLPLVVDLASAIRDEQRSAPLTEAPIAALPPGSKTT